MLQMRPTDPNAPHQVRYSPSRDIAYLYPNVVQTAENMLYERRYGPLHEWLDREGVTEDQLAETVQKFCLVLNEAHKNPEEDLYAVMDRIGFSEMPHSAQVALTYYIGTMMAGTFFQAIRDITPSGGDTTPEVVRLCRTGERMAEYAARGPLGRWWVRFKARWFPRKPCHTIGGSPP